jgi:hypothetical protein
MRIPRLADLGLAMREDIFGDTRWKGMAPAYASPEQARGEECRTYSVRQAPRRRKVFAAPRQRPGRSSDDAGGEKSLDGPRRRREVSKILGSASAGAT